MTTYDLMLKVKEILEANGFETRCTKCLNSKGEMMKDFEYDGSASKDGKLWREPVKGYSFTNLYGYGINFNVVYRSNGANENISVDIIIYKWKASCGTRIAKERININMSDKSINNRVNKIIDIYNSLEISREA